jgi:HD-GYP domain-containing protein (c-di-GMP phosphodiesterase class II)
MEILVELRGSALDPDITDAFLGLLSEMDDAPSVNPMEAPIG